VKRGKLRGNGRLLRKGSFALQIYKGGASKMVEERDLYCLLMAGVEGGREDSD